MSKDIKSTGTTVTLLSFSSPSADGSFFSKRNLKGHINPSQKTSDSFLTEKTGAISV